MKKWILPVAAAIGVFVAGVLLFYYGEPGNIDLDRPIEVEENPQWGDSSIEDTDGQEDSPDLDIEDEKIDIKITATGDVMFHMPQVNAARTEHGYNFYPVFSNIKYINERADLSLANFETVTAGEDVGYQGFPRFNSPDSAVLALEATGFDVLSTANNHCLDQGKDGIIKTIDNIHNHNMDNIGTYKEPKTHLIKDVKGIKVGLLSYTYGLNGLDGMLSDEDRQAMIDLIDEDLIEQDIKEIKEKSDIVLVYIHWGVEYQSHPNDYQVSLGDKILDWGADGILGSHPHVVQRAEHRDDNKYIIYSMGNFVSNQRAEYLNTPYVEDGVIVELNITKDKDETMITSVNHIPTWVYRYHNGSRWNYTVLPIEDGQMPDVPFDLPENIRHRMEKSYTDTMDVINQNR